MHCGHVSCGGLCRRYGSPSSVRPNLRNVNPSSPNKAAMTPRGGHTTHSPSHYQSSPTPTPRHNTPRVAPTSVAPARSPQPYTPRRSHGGYNNSSPQYDGEYDRHSHDQDDDYPHRRVSNAHQSSPAYSPGYSSPAYSPQMDGRGHRGEGGHVDEATETPGGLISPNEQTLDEIEFSPYAQKQSGYHHQYTSSPQPERFQRTSACTPSCGVGGRKCPHVSCDTAPCRRFPSGGISFGDSAFLDNADYSRPSPHYTWRG